jgi:hypothetical protein
VRERRDNGATPVPPTLLPVALAALFLLAASAHAAPSPDVVDLPDTGHHPTLERGAARFRAIVARWLIRHGCGAQP